MTTCKRRDTRPSPTSSTDLQPAFEDPDEVPSSWTGADNNARRREAARHASPATRTADLLAQAESRFYELSKILIQYDNPREERGPVARLQGLYMRIITELEESQHDETKISRDKHSFAEDFPRRLPGNEDNREDIMDRLVDELLGIMTGELHATGAFRTIAAGLATRLAKPNNQSSSVPDTLLQLARSTSVIQQIQDSAIQGGTHKNNPVFRAYEKLIKDTEAILAREVQSSLIGPHVADLLASSTNRTPFTAYLASGGARQSQWAMHEDDPSNRQERQFDGPTDQSSPTRGETSNSPPTRSPSRSREDSGRVQRTGNIRRRSRPRFRQCHNNAENAPSSFRKMQKPRQRILRRDLLHQMARKIKPSGGRMP